MRPWRSMRIVRVSRREPASGVVRSVLRVATSDTAARRGIAVRIEIVIAREPAPCEAQNGGRRQTVRWHNMPTKFLGSDFQINEDDGQGLGNGIDGNQVLPQVTTLSDGRLAVVYQSDFFGNSSDLEFDRGDLQRRRQRLIDQLSRCVRSQRRSVRAGCGGAAGRWLRGRIYKRAACGQQHRR